MARTARRAALRGRYWPLPGAGRPPSAASGEVVPLKLAARRAAAEHYQANGQPITRDALRARSASPTRLPRKLLRQIRQDGGES